jgi:hypothetical protein
MTTSSSKVFITSCTPTINVRVFVSSCEPVNTCAHSCVYMSTCVYIHSSSSTSPAANRGREIGSETERASEGERKRRERKSDLGDGIAAGAAEDGGEASTGNLGVWPQVHPRGRCRSQGGRGCGREGREGRVVGTGKGRKREGYVMIHYISIPRIAPEFSRTGACASSNFNSKGTACKHTRMQSLWPELTRRSRSPGDGRARDGEGLRSNCKEQC